MALVHLPAGDDWVSLLPEDDPYSYVIRRLADRDEVPAYTCPFSFGVTLFACNTRPYSCCFLDTDAPPLPPRDYTFFTASSHPKDWSWMTGHRDGYDVVWLDHFSERVFLGIFVDFGSAFIVNNDIAFPCAFAGEFHTENDDRWWLSRRPPVQAPLEAADFSVMCAYLVLLQALAIQI